MKKEIGDLPHLEYSGQPNLPVSGYKRAEQLSIMTGGHPGVLLTKQEWKDLVSSGGSKLVKRPNNSMLNKGYNVFIPYEANGGEATVQAALDEAKLVDEGGEPIVF